MRKISKDGIVVAFLDEGGKISSGDSFLADLNKSGVPQCTVARQGRSTVVKIDQGSRVFPGAADYVVSLKNYLEQHGYVLQLMGDML